MKQYNKHNWFELIFHSYSRQIFKQLFPATFMMGIYTTFIVFILEVYLKDVFPSTTTFHSILGIVLGLFLVFRTNTAYDRWWEGRKVWGALVNVCRTLALKLNAFLSYEDIENRTFYGKNISNFVYAMKEHLRAGVLLEELDLNEKAIFEIKKWQHKPNYISALLFEKANGLKDSEKIDGYQFLVLDTELRELLNIIGKCERIRKTPIPYSYSMFLKKFIFIYTITLPFGFLSSLHFYTIPVVMMLFYILVSIELIAEEIEDPFGRDENDLPTDELSLNISNNIKEILIRT